MHIHEWDSLDKFPQWLKLCVTKHQDYKRHQDVFKSICNVNKIKEEYLKKDTSKTKKDISKTKVDISKTKVDTSKRDQRDKMMQLVMQYLLMSTTLICFWKDYYKTALITYSILLLTYWLDFRGIIS